MSVKHHHDEDHSIRRRLADLERKVSAGSEWRQTIRSVVELAEMIATARDQVAAERDALKVRVAELEAELERERSKPCVCEIAKRFAEGIEGTES